MSRPVEEEEEGSDRITRVGGDSSDSSRNASSQSGRPASLTTSSQQQTNWNEEDRPRTPVDEHDAMEAWLDEHPAFLHNYFVRKASRSIVDDWLKARTCHSGVTGASLSGGNIPVGAGGVFALGNSASAPVSGSTTPVRKISAHEFEKCSLFLRPMVSTTSDGTPTFLPVTPSEAGGTGPGGTGAPSTAGGGGSQYELPSRPPRKSRQELEGEFD